MNVRTLLTCALSVFLFVPACSDQSDAPEADARSEAEAPARSAAGPHYALAHFEGAFDPATGELSITMLEAPSPEGLRELHAPLWRQVRASNGARDTITLRNGSGGVFATPADCGVVGNPIVDTLGMVCASVELTSNYGSDTLTDVYAMLTNVTPDTGYNGYASSFPEFGGADPALAYPGPNAPTDLGGGLWHYGDVTAGEAKEVTWYFHNAGGAYRFSGQVVAAFPERRNGADDNGDGAVDEGPFADGETCSDASECYGGYCEAGVCASAPLTCPPDTWGPTCTPCNCDDGVFCNGAETCNPVTGCESGTPPIEDDGDACTIEDCDEVNGTVSRTPVPDGVCGPCGDATSCLDLCGVPNGDDSTCADCCGVANGDGTTCDGVCGPCGDATSCLDLCGVPDGDDSTCADCCGVANGDGTTCDGVCGPCGDATSCLDLCGVPNGDDSTCADCCGVANGDGTTCAGACGPCGDVTSCADICGVPNGDGTTCNGVCGAGESSAGSDCDGICDVVDSSAGPDCDGVCDSSDAPGSVDCDGVCDVACDPDTGWCDPFVTAEDSGVRTRL